MRTFRQQKVCSRFRFGAVGVVFIFHRPSSCFPQHCRAICLDYPTTRKHFGPFAATSSTRSSNRSHFPKPLETDITMKLFKVLAAVVLIGTATANYTPDPPADRQRGAQLLLTDNADCSEGGTRNIYGGECFNIQTLFFAISEFDGDLVNPDIGCISNCPLPFSQDFSSFSAPGFFVAPRQLNTPGHYRSANMCCSHCASGP